MLFRSLDPEKNLKLREEKKLFVMYSAMIHHYPYGARSYLLDDPGEGSFRFHLDNALMVSKENFLNLAHQFMDKLITLAEANQYKKQFHSLIIGPDVKANLTDLAMPLGTFLQHLCFVGASTSLAIFVKRYPEAIKLLSDQDFNALCVSAASNLFYDFMHFLCQQGRSMNEYSTREDSINCTVLTPYAATCFGLFNRMHPSEDDFDTTIQLLELLVEHKADPYKKYMTDDAHEEEIKKALEKGEGYTVFDSNESDFDRNAHMNQTRKYFGMRLVSYLVKLKIEHREQLKNTYAHLAYR